MGVSDVKLSEFAQFSYFNLPPDLKENINDGIGLSIKEVSDYYIENPEFYFKNITEINGVKVPTEITNDVNDGVDYQWNLLKKYSSDEYSNVKIIDYTNQNDLNGYAGYAIRLESGEVVIASRGSESPLDDSMYSILAENKIDGVCNNLIDWIDNFRLPSATQTEQQKAAKEFANKVGNLPDVETIILTGHSKGGNNSTYINVTVDENVRKKIISCVTFNAPGHSKEFIDGNKFLINKLLKEGKIKEYQNEKDIVSDILHIFGNPIIISTNSSNNMLSFEHHSIYTYEIIDGEFSIKLEGEKSYFANLVNSAVKDLTEGLTTEEMKELIDVVERVLNEGINMKTLHEFIIYLPEEVLFIKSLLSYALSQAFVELYKKTGDPVLVGLALVADKVNSCKFKKNMIGTRGFNKIKEVIRSGIDYLNEKYENYKLNKSIKDKYKEIEKITINFDKSFSEDDIKVALKQSKNEFLGDTGFLESVICGYDNEINKLNIVKKNLEGTLDNLLSTGWNGASKDAFMNIKYLAFKNELKKSIDKLNTNKAYLELCREGIYDIEAEESRLLLCFQ